MRGVKSRAVTQLESHWTNARSRREGLIEWVLEGSTHILDLAPNRHDTLTKIGLEKLFSRLLIELDRELLGTRNVHLRSSHERLRVIAFPEKLEVNPHLHAFADFSPWRPQLQQSALEALLTRTWYRLTEGSGTMRMFAEFDRGAAVYRTKEALGRSHDYFHSWDYHRGDKLQRQSSAACPQRRPAVRKSRTH
jgi:hypothetical protein